MRRRLIMGILLAVAIGGLVFVASAPTHKSGTQTRPPAVEGVSPPGGDLDLRQITLAADLAPGYTGYLALDGVEIPADDLQIVDALNTITLKPQPGSDYQQLTPGPHCAEVVYWPIGQSRDAGQSYTWCFSLH